MSVMPRHGRRRKMGSHVGGEVKFCLQPSPPWIAPRTLTKSAPMAGETHLVCISRAAGPAAGNRLGRRAAARPAIRRRADHRPGRRASGRRRTWWRKPGAEVMVTRVVEAMDSLGAATISNPPSPAGARCALIPHARAGRGTGSAVIVAHAASVALGPHRTSCGSGPRIAEGAPTACTSSASRRMRWRRSSPIAAPAVPAVRYGVSEEGPMH
jgi:hypothetical protein